MALKFFAKPFAVEGETEEIPDDLQPTGQVNFTTGYGFDYERDPASDPAAKDIERKKMNWLFGAVTEALRQIQATGAHPYITPEQNGGTPYPYIRGSRCWYDAGGATGLDIYESLVDNNTAPPTDAAKWARAGALATVNRPGLIPSGTIGQILGMGAGGVAAFQNLDLSGYATMASLSAHAALTAPHSAVSAATAGRLVLRDANGRAQVATPDVAADIANKGYVDTAASSGIFVGEIRLVPFRAADLTVHAPGWYFANGDRYLLSSPQGQALNALPSSYKSDWRITLTNDGAGNSTINLPSFFHTDGRGFFPRAGAAPGVVVEDAIRNIYGVVDFYRSAPWTSGHSGVFTNGGANVDGCNDTGATRPRELRFDASMLVPTADENRPLHITLIPAIFLDV